MTCQCGEPGSCGRRSWLVRVLSAAIAATVGAILYPVARFLRPRPVTQSGAMQVVAPYRVADLRPDADGQWPSPFNFAGKPCLLIKTPEGEVKAFNAICTHTDCTVKYRSEQADIFCSCHGGVYDTNGGNVSGPPPRPLTAYKVSLRGKPGQEEIIVSRT
ncbi:MAG: Rieske (2Fe-2S) protein [Planctomycetia bacterium]|nr:MAG: Rieske (2Fe-2S) protein [Planctomycetia bacterium]